MAETVEINVLGDTAKEQWLTVIHINKLVIESNIDHALGHVREGEIGGWDETVLETAKRVLGDFCAEMERLVNGVM